MQAPPIPHVGVPEGFWAASLQRKGCTPPHSSPLHLPAGVSEKTRVAALGRGGVHAFPPFLFGVQGGGFSTRRSQAGRGMRAPPPPPMGVTEGSRAASLGRKGAWLPHLSPPRPNVAVLLVFSPPSAGLRGGCLTASPLGARGGVPGGPTKTMHSLSGVLPLITGVK